jgi:hypothetical protein
MSLRRQDPDRHRVAGRPVAPDRAKVSGHASHRGRVNGDDQVTRTDPCARGGAVVGDPVDEQAVTMLGCSNAEPRAWCCGAAALIHHLVEDRLEFIDRHKHVAGDRPLEEGGIADEQRTDAYQLAVRERDIDFDRFEDEIADRQYQSIVGYHHTAAFALGAQCAGGTRRARDAGVDPDDRLEHLLRSRRDAGLGICVRAGKQQRCRQCCKQCDAAQGCHCALKTVLGVDGHVAYQSSQELVRMGMLSPELVPAHRIT